MAYASWIYMELGARVFKSPAQRNNKSSFVAIIVCTNKQQIIEPAGQWGAEHKAHTDADAHLFWCWGRGL